jgi:hypothetical protein
MSTRKPQKKHRGPSRPIDPRNAPGRSRAKGPDTFGIALIGISGLVVVALLIFLAVQNNQGSTQASGNSVPVPTTASNPQSSTSVTPNWTATEIAFATVTSGLPRVTAQQAKALFDGNNAKFIDVRPKTDYDQGHIKGAINIPFDQAATRATEFPKTGNVVLYCQ